MSLVRWLIKMRKIAAILLLLLSSQLQALQAQQASVQSLRLWSAPDHSRLVFDTSAAVSHKIFSLRNPDRLVIDFNNAVLNTSLSGFNAKDPYVHNIRSGVRGSGKLRVVLDLKTKVQPKSFALTPNREYGHRLVVDLFGPRPVVQKRPTDARVEPKVTPKQSPARDVIIAIDAGHGGEDPGAQGHKGTKEKDVVLSIARKLAALIKKEKGLRPVMIRNGDYYLGLRKRVQMARQHKADLFISIHADAFKDKRVQGSSVFTLSNRGASSEAARWLAERENSADLVGGVELKDKDDVLASVLLDLSQTGTRQASHDVAGKVLSSIGRVGKTHKRAVQRAGFAVLKSPDVPSILVETAFITNPTEEKRLKSQAYQRKLASSINSGIRDYFHANPPPGTLLAQVLPRKYMINRGDTLAMIARQYQISVRRLRSANGLVGDSIMVGQVLQIPET